MLSVGVPMCFADVPEPFRGYPVLFVSVCQLFLRFPDAVLVRCYDLLRLYKVLLKISYASPTGLSLFSPKLFYVFHVCS